MSWLSDTRTSVAAEKILDAAAELFVRDGVAAVGMNEIAKAAGCSRATLYRYFENREALHIAYVHREARTITGQVTTAVAGIDDPTERLVSAVLTSLRLVRENPALSAWFRPGEYVGGSLALHSEVLNAMVSAFVSAENVTAVTHLRAKWYVRVIISLLSYPEDNPEDERTLITEFVAPMISADVNPTPAASAQPDGSATTQAR
ncbi:TetR/AcrR family transcriptional regulator [Mycobacteroides chelonae]|jgi:AcrR family transcriptional regulator|uniref:TetR/AcrR family transcriptional regulator n=1 Tax=Mycobacteroides chelonae TaxID=1774 RepID=UPI0008A92488|nr:TetR/AcrR family transcriptional regulator [Mycobacteroides chelonae]MBV0917403.1 TetR/AcrR family transcriptional regulator [Mycobacteroides chelonae]OHT80227.1 TetR family transcriptional regulator [Mycobacteroides chelonae]OHU44372.1 TetR family transcriptional regulator [Mycobacteroides chelonae]OHU64443.1 TetR family transcriptional regulator [Mycobacteroides chelonae]GLE56314.1 TetR family transcriptional regulator [Mycobacteroides chelonae]